MGKRAFAVAISAMAIVPAIGLGATSSNAAAQGTQHVTVDILGKDVLLPNGYLENTYRFPKTITIRRGGEITFVNRTTDGHTMTMVVASDLPRNGAQVDNCGLCNQVTNLFGAGGSGPPKYAQIDGGVPGDGSDHDADKPDPGVPPGFPLKALIEDFDTPAHTNPHAKATIGDATIIGPVGGPVTQRTIVVTAPPGTYHYMCTFHPWMQGTIIVTA
jgi:plastocyanin